MSEDEEFLARWSRRKHEAKQGGQAEPQAVEPVKAQTGGPAGGPMAEPADPDVDLSNLPPIDSIDAATDITAFLGKGVPSELSSAALRRAWATDPAIRDFVGLAENAFDFNDPNAMSGFGSLDLTQAELSRIVDWIVGGMQQVAADPPDKRAAVEDAAQLADRESSPGHASPQLEPVADDRTPDGSTSVELKSAFTAPQPATIEISEPGEASHRRRRHGGALPS
jgi:hypothetical protein